MSVTFRTPTSRKAALALTSIVGATLLVACSAQPQSLADYLAAICAAQFRPAPSDEAPYLAENAGAMTKISLASTG